MIQIIAGKKGSGKTKRLIDMTNNAVKTSSGNVVFLDKNDSYMYEVDRAVRFVNDEEYSVSSAEMFLGFLGGMLDSNNDVQPVYIGAILSSSEYLLVLRLFRGVKLSQLAVYAVAMVLLAAALLHTRGCTLREVCATNKTHLRDYEAAVSEQTRAILKVHTSNYRIVGCTEAVPREALAALARERGLPLIEDLGSGALVELEQYGIHGEPTVQRSLRAGVDVASFSGDKLLGGPQAGLLVGRKEYIERLKKHPLARALRLDKMTLAALHATLRAYLDTATAAREIPTLAMLSAGEEALREKALRLQQALAGAGVASQLVKTGDAVGGGSAPAQELPGWAVALDPGKHSVDELEERLRMRAKPIVARIHRGQYLLCVRTIDEKDFAGLAAAAAEALR